MFGAGFGPRPPLDATWPTCVISASTFGETVGDLPLVDRWVFSTRHVAAMSSDRDVRVLADDAQVERFLCANAPDSAVWPGHSEILA